MSYKIAEIRARHEAGPRGMLPMQALATAEDDRATLLAEVERQARHIEELREKIDAERSCACSFDAPGDVCAAHSPALMQAWEDGWFARDCWDADWHQNPYQRKKKETKP